MFEDSLRFSMNARPEGLFKNQRNSIVEQATRNILRTRLGSSKRNTLIINKELFKTIQNRILQSQYLSQQSLQGQTLLALEEPNFYHFQDLIEVSSGEDQDKYSQSTDNCHIMNYESSLNGEEGRTMPSIQIMNQEIAINLIQKIIQSQKEKLNGQKRQSSAPPLQGQGTQKLRKKLRNQQDEAMKLQSHYSNKRNPVTSEVDLT